MIRYPWEYTRWRPAYRTTVTVSPTFTPERLALDGACLHPRLTEARDCPTCGPTVAAELRRTVAPHLHIKRTAPGMWAWAVTRDGAQYASDLVRTHGEALAVGLAALEAASVRTTR